MADIDYAARVQRGIALLDEKWPGWATEIDLEKLDIRHDERCVTAQYAASRGGSSSWQTGERLLGLEEGGEYELHGFNVAWEAVAPAIDRDYATLNGLWKAEIIRRREATQSEASES